MTKRLTSKRALVSGVSLRIGRMIAVRPAELRAHVAIDYPLHVAQARGSKLLGRAASSKEAALAFLATNEAAYITGQTRFVDGALYPDVRPPWSSGE